MAFGGAVGIIGVVGAALLGAEVLRVVYGAEYVREDVLIWVMIAAGLGNVASPINFALVAAKRFRAEMAIKGGALVVVLAASLLLVPATGALGACRAAASAAAAQLVLAALTITRVVDGRKRGLAPGSVH